MSQFNGTGPISDLLSWKKDQELRVHETEKGLEKAAIVWRRGPSPAVGRSKHSSRDLNRAGREGDCGGTG